MTRNRLLIAVGAASVLLAAACSHLNVKPAADDVMGFRYYLPRPYLLVTSESARVVWLPDLKQQYAVEPVFGSGTMKFDFAFEDGWRLTKVNPEVDSKTPEVIEKLTGAVASLGALALTGRQGAPTDKPESQPKTEPGPPKPFQLYSIDYDSGGSTVKGLRPLFSVVPPGLAEQRPPTVLLGGSAGRQTLVIVASDPESCEVSVDSIFVGITPVSVGLALGKHTFEARKQGHQNYVYTMNVYANTELRLRAKLTKTTK
jgi:hypothetical protein